MSHYAIASIVFDDAVNITSELHDPCMLVMISAKKREKI